MAEVKKTKGVIAILNGGGDVPGLNPAIRAVTSGQTGRGIRLSASAGVGRYYRTFKVNKADNSNCYHILTDDIVNKAGRTGGTFLHTSRTRPSPHVER